MPSPPPCGNRCRPHPEPASSLPPPSLDLLDSLGDQAILLDERGCILAVNHAWRRFNTDHGPPGLADQAVGRDFLQPDYLGANHTDEQAPAALRAGIQAVLDGVRHSFQLDYPYLSSHALFWLQANVTPLRGPIGGALVLLKDISESKRLAEALQASEERLRTIVETSPDSVMLVKVLPDQPCRAWPIALCNQRTADLHGYATPAAMIGVRIGALKAPSLFAHAPEADWLPRLRQAGTLVGETRHRRLDGTIFDLEYRVSRLVIAGEEYYLGIDRDITARKQAEARARLQSDALDAAANAIVITNRAGRIEWANPAFTTFTGYTAAEARGRRPGDLLNSGRHSPAFMAELWATILAGRVWHGEIINRRKDGRLYTEEMTITPIRDEHGAIIQFIAVKQDITQRKLLEEQFRQAQKMEAVGQLAGGIAHDFNNILAAVMLHLGLLQRERGLSPATRATLNDLSEEIQRGAGLSRQLLAFSRHHAMEPHRLDLHPLVAGLLKMLRRLLGEHIVLDLQGEPGTAWVEADTGMIEQIVINLCLNARDAMPRGGRLTLRLANIEYAASGDARPGRFVRLSVSDTGMGIAADVLPHIFEPFFTTKDNDHGTGLGLATVHSITQQHHGWVDVDSVPGQGATFHVHLPASPPPESRAPTATDTPPPRAPRDETILLVEDEAGLRFTIALTLRHFGYHVLEASDGPAALRLWQQHGPRIDLFLTDLVLPHGIGGDELIQRFLLAKPALKVVATTGYTQNRLSPDLTADPRVTLLRKPFNPAQLLTTVHARLIAP